MELHPKTRLIVIDIEVICEKNQKLSIRSAEEIKKRIKNGDRSVDIAKMYGVSQQTICDIKHNRIYKHVEV